VTFLKCHRHTAQAPALLVSPTPYHAPPTTHTHCAGLSSSCVFNTLLCSAMARTHTVQASALPASTTPYHALPMAHSHCAGLSSPCIFNTLSRPAYGTHTHTRTHTHTHTVQASARPASTPYQALPTSPLLLCCPLWWRAFVQQWSPRLPRTSW